MKYISAGGPLFIGGCILFQTGQVTENGIVSVTGGCAALIGVVLIVIGLIKKKDE